MANDDSDRHMEDDNNTKSTAIEKPADDKEGGEAAAGSTSTLAEGALVWAQLKGFPYWPAVVTIDPMDAVAVKAGEGPKAVGKVHVHFLAYENQRAWVKRNKIMEFHGLPHFRKLEAAAGCARKKDFAPSARHRPRFDTAVAHASAALQLDNNAERLKMLGFEYVPVAGKPVPTAAARKIVSPPPQSDQTVIKKRKRASSSVASKMSMSSSSPPLQQQPDPIVIKKRKRASSSVSSRMSTSSSSSSASERDLKSEAGDDAREPADSKRAKVIKKKGRKSVVSVMNPSEEIRDLKSTEAKEDDDEWRSGDEDAAEYQPRLGGLVWGRMTGYPFWPCFVTKTVDGGPFTRVVGKRCEVHVQFFNWNNESGWVSKVLPWCDLDAFKNMGKRAPKGEAREFAPPSSKTMENKWMGAVAEAQSTAHLGRRQRYESLAVSPKKKKSAPPPKKPQHPKAKIEIETSALPKREVNKKAKNGRPKAIKPSRDKREKPCPKRHKLHPPSERNWPENDDEVEMGGLTKLLSVFDLPEGWSAAKDEDERDEFHSPDGSTFRSFEDIARHLFDQNASTGRRHPRRRAASVCDGAGITDCGQGWFMSEVDRRRYPLRSLTRKSAAGALDGRVQLFADPALPDKWTVKRVYPWPPQSGAAELVFESPREENYSSKVEVAALVEPRGHPAVELEHIVRRIVFRRRAASLSVNVENIRDEELLLHPILGKTLVPTYVDMIHLPDVFLEHACVRVFENDNETIFTDAVTNDFIAKKILYD